MRRRHRLQLEVVLEPIDPEEAAQALRRVFRVILEGPKSRETNPSPTPNLGLNSEKYFHNRQIKR